MPTYARGQIVVEDMVGVYHCIARCVRRAFLCGIDPYTGQDYSHRKEWILDRLRDLAGLFAIEVCGYSVRTGNSPLETCDRPDAWLCELTLQETATEPASTTAAGAASPRRESASEAGPVAIAVADAVGASQPSADSGPTSGVAAPVAAPRRLNARASDQGFLPIEVEHYVMLLDWTGRELRADKRGAIPDHLAPIVERLGLNRSNWVETVRGFGRLFKQAAGRSSSLVDAAAAAAGSKARRRLEPPLYRPPARRRAVNRHLRQASTRRPWPPCALHSLPGPVSPGQTTQLLASTDHAHTTVVSIRSVSDRLEAPRADALVHCCEQWVHLCLNFYAPGRLLRPTSSWVSEFSSARQL